MSADETHFDTRKESSNAGRSITTRNFHVESARAFNKTRLSNEASTVSRRLTNVEISRIAEQRAIIYERASYDVLLCALAYVRKVVSRKASRNIKSRKW